MCPGNRGYEPGEGELLARSALHGAAAAGVAAATYALSAYLLNLDFTLTILMVDSVGAQDMTRRINHEIVGLDALDHLERTEVLDRITVVQAGGWSLIYGAWTVVDVVAGAVRLGLTLLLLGTVSPWLLLLLVFAALPLWLDPRGQHAVAKAETDTAEAFRLQRHLFNLATEAAGGKETGSPARATRSPRCRHGPGTRRYGDGSARACGRRVTRSSAGFCSPRASLAGSSCCSTVPRTVRAASATWCWPSRSR
jgi:hypothetical protein